MTRKLKPAVGTQPMQPEELNVVTMKLREMIEPYVARLVKNAVDQIPYTIEVYVREIGAREIRAMVREVAKHDLTVNLRVKERSR